MKNKTTEILFAGFGGQGIMLMGKLIAQTGLNLHKNVTWMPAYGAEVRGGTAYSVTKISDKEIANPIIANPDILVAMNEQSMAKYEGKLKPKGILIMNKSLARAKPSRKDIKTVSIPMTEIASKLGSSRCANMIAIGALLKRSKIFPLRAVTAALKEMMGDKESVYQLNKKAIEKGYTKA
ncbi:MAG: 2-oxoacid:acceptor oxidoreductase family protein [Candidatus Omnitrophota bacterium]|nr:2-oxoacid:acceptor oxidoreductase family protein [Candidatus Omnitrophota bacterium]